MTTSNEQINFNVADSFKCPIYLGKKPEWVKDLNKASDPIIARVRKTWKPTPARLATLSTNFSKESVADT